MRKQLVVVVHGVGVKEAGVSTDLLSAALDDAPKTASGMGQLRPHSSDDFRLSEKAKYTKGGLRTTFPARIRRFRSYDRPVNGNMTGERVVADFYWGDIAAIGSGAVGTVVALFKIVLGLSHIVRENAASVFPGANRFDRAMRKLASFAVLTIHGPIAALNILILFGLCLSRLIRELPDWSWLQSEHFEVAAILLITLGAGWWFLYRVGGFLYCLLFWSLCGAGVALALSHGLTVWIDKPDILFALDQYLKQESCRYAVQTPGGVGDAVDACQRAYQGLYLTGLRLFAVVVLCWAAVLVAAVVLGLGRFVRPLPGQERSPSLLFSSVALMTLLWFVMVSAAWAAVGNLPLGIIENPNHVTSALRGLVPALAGLVLLALAAWVLNWRKTRALGGLTEVEAEFFAAERDRPGKYRLILSSWLAAVLAVFVLVVGLVTLAAALPVVGLDWGLPDWLAMQSVSLMQKAMIVAGLCATLLLGFARQATVAGLSIAADIIAYLNNYAWDTVKTAAAPTAPVTGEGYELRQRIQDRLHVFVKQLLDQERPDELILVTHSQGTVIALDVIATDGRDWRARLAGNTEMPRLGLITMGSPYLHLYRHYFPQSFDDHRARPELRPVAENGVLDDWTNIFRVDDFVGTYIDGRTIAEGIDPDQAWPVERPVPKNGHTMYWVDERVSEILRQKLAL